MGMLLLWSVEKKYKIYRHNIENTISDAIKYTVKYTTKSLNVSTENTNYMNFNDRD